MPEPTKNPLPLPLDGPNSYQNWKSRVEGAKSLIDRHTADWDHNKERYLAQRPTPLAKSEEIIVPKDFSNVEQKKAQLFFQSPEVQLEPKLPGLELAVPIFEAVLNYYLGPDGVNAKRMAHEVLSDALMASGIFATKIGYETVTDGTKQIQTGSQPDPNWMPPPPPPVMPGAVLGLTPPPQPPQIPIMSEVPNIISEKYLWERISPVKLLLPEEFTGSDFDMAPWLGFEFLMDEGIARSTFNLPDDFHSYAGDDERLVGGAKDKNVGSGRSQTKQVRGWEIWYKAAHFDDTVKHPDQQRVLVVIEGMTVEARHEDSPFQFTDAQGKLSGMPGFPIHIGTLRYISDTAIPPSDCMMSRYQVEEISKGRTQMIRQRERSIPLRFADLGRVGGEEGLAKIEKNIWQGIIPLESMTANDPPVIEVSRATFPRENFEFDQIANRDLAEIWAIDSNQRGTTNQTGRTATELQLAQNNSNIRMDAERTRFLDWFMRGVQKLASLIQQFADTQDYVAIVGPDGMKRLMAWDKQQIAGSFVYKARPNSSQRIDAQAERSQFLQTYNLLAPSPFINQPELITQLVKKFDLDPSKLISMPQPKPVEVPKVSFAFTDASLNPSNPAFPIVMEILRQGGIQISDQATASAQKAASLPGSIGGVVPHGDPSAPPPARDMGGGAGGMSGGPVNQHQTERTGGPSGPPLGGLAKPTPIPGGHA